MHLAPQHFQAQNRYFEELQHFVASALFPHAYGLVGLEMDDDAIRNGTVSVLHARGIMSDGLPFHFPDDPPPEPLAIEELFSPTAQSHRVLLEIAPYRSIGANCAEDNGKNAGDFRFRESPSPVRDNLTGGDEQLIPMAGKNFRLRLETPSGEGAGGEGAGEGSPGGEGSGAASPASGPEGSSGNTDGQSRVRLPIARVRRDGSGRFQYDPAFMPPALQAGGNRALVTLLARVVEVLESRARTLAMERGGASPGGSGTAELVGFWFTHAVHTHLPALRQHLDSRTTHPARVFADLSALAGALGTFSLSADVNGLPLYRHAEPEEGFEALERAIRKGLETVIPTRVLNLSVRAGEGYFHTAEAPDRRIFEPGAHWYLAIRSTASRASVLEAVPRLVKICSAKHIERLVREAYPGLEVEHAPTPAAGISPRPGTEYFRLRRTEPCWRSIVETGEVGIYVPGAITEPEMELLVVLDEEGG